MAKSQIRKNTLKDGTVKYSAVLEILVNGKREIITAPGGPWLSEREAIEAGIQLEVKYSTDALANAALQGKMTLAEWGEKWLTGIEKSKHRSVKTFRARMKNWIMKPEYLGRIPLKDLDSVHIDEWVRTTIAHHEPNYQRALIDTLKNCLNAAVRAKILIRNPAAGLKPDDTKAAVKARDAEQILSRKDKIWNHEEVVKILDAAQGDTAEALPIMGLKAGLRPGEVEGCRRTDVDLHEGIIWVRFADRVAALEPRGRTKSGEHRKIKISFDTVTRLSNLFDRQDREAAAKNEPPPEWVLPLTQRQASDRLKAICTKANVKVLHPHCCRHTFASLLLSAWVPSATVAKLLGHSNSGVTERHYAHAMPESLENATLILDRMLGLSPGPIPSETATKDSEAA